MKSENTLLSTAKECGDTFEEVITVLSEWNTTNDKFRLVNVGAGPDQLQVMEDGKWVEEKSYYRWGVLTSRVKVLEERLKNATEAGA